MKSNCKIYLEIRNKKDIEIISKIPVNADISYAGIRLRYYTGYRVDKACDFDVNNEILRKSKWAWHGSHHVEAMEVNDDFLAIKAKIREILRNQTIPPAKECIKNALNVLLCKADMPEDTQLVLAAFKHYLAVTKVSPARKKSIENVYRHLERYQNFKKKTLTFENCTPALFADFVTYMDRVAELLDTYRNMPIYLVPKLPEIKEFKKLPHNKWVKPKGNNTKADIFTKIKTFWNWAISQGYTNVYPFGKGKFEIGGTQYGTPIYLTKEERNILYTTRILDEELRIVRDLFVFQCFVGCRIGDFVKLKKENIVKVGIKNKVETKDKEQTIFYEKLQYIASKTIDNKPYTISVPLSPKAKRILAKYKNMEGNKLLPFVAEQKYNICLKKLFKLCGLNRQVIRRNPTTGKNENVQLFEIASSHMARRTFLGLLYNANVKDDVSYSMSGHTKGSKAAGRYYEPSEAQKKEAIALID